MLKIKNSKNQKKQEKNIKGFLKSSKGAEILEIIIGVVIAVALGAFAWWFIRQQLSKASEEKTFDHDNIITEDNSNSPIQNSFTSPRYIKVGDKIIDFE